VIKIWGGSGRRAVRSEPPLSGKRRDVANPISRKAYEVRGGAQRREASEHSRRNTVDFETLSQMINQYDALQRREPLLPDSMQSEYDLKQRNLKFLSL